MNIEDALIHRTDLSPFLVHLTRDYNRPAKDNLMAIMLLKEIRAMNSFGIAKRRILDSALPNKIELLKSQKCVCFTETPLELLKHLTIDDQARDLHFKPFGIGLPKKFGRINGINPVWYVDITRGDKYREWLTEPINKMIVDALETGIFNECSTENPAISNISKITPFIEQMGSGSGKKWYKKEFAWEREWRHVGKFVIPKKYIVFAPESDFGEIRKLVLFEDAPDISALLVDPMWDLNGIHNNSVTCSNGRKKNVIDKISPWDFFDSSALYPF